MKRPTLFFCCMLVFGAVSCGGGGNMTTTMPPPAPFNGSLGFVAGSQVTNVNSFSVGGMLQTDANGNVSGTLGITSTALNNTCFPAGTTASFTGTISQGRLTLTSAAINGQVVNLAITVSKDGNFFSNGAFTVTGGCLNGDHGSLLASRLVTGTYTGTFTVNGDLIGVTLTLNPPGLPDSSGFFQFMGNAVFSNSAACGGFTSAASQSGGQLVVQAGPVPATDVALAMSSNTISGITFSGTTLDGSATTLSGSFGIQFGPCAGLHGDATLRKS